MSNRFDIKIFKNVDTVFFVLLQIHLEHRVMTKNYLHHILLNDSILTIRNEYQHSKKFTVF